MTAISSVKSPRHFGEPSHCDDGSGSSDGDVAALQDEH